VLLVLCLLLSRSVGNCAARQNVAGVLAGVALVAAAAGAVLFPVGGSSKQELAVERQALDARGVELMTRVALQGSPLACLGGRAGETVESSCEKLLFASPETIAAAVSYVAAQLALLADYATLGRRAGVNEPAGLANLRGVIEADRFGLVAQVLAGRDGCTPSRCEALALLKDASQVRTNLEERTFDFHVARYAPGWPSGAPAALAAVPTPAEESMRASLAAAPNPTGVPASKGRPLRSEIFLPSAASIPPVSIMSAEPAGPEGVEPSGARAAAGSASKGAGGPRTITGVVANPSATSARKPVRSADEAPPGTSIGGRVPLTASAGP
jgi:hypothetical protein